MKAVKKRGICIRMACQAFRISESCYRYERKLDAENEEVAAWLIKLTDNHRNWGFDTRDMSDKISRAAADKR